MSVLAGSSQRTPVVARVFFTVLVGAGALVFVVPFYWLLVASTRSNGEIFTDPPPLLPGGQLWQNIVGLFESSSFGAALVNSLVVATLYTVIGGFVCTAAGYAFAKFTFRGRGVFFAIVLVVLALPNQVTLVPLFQLMVSLGWLDSVQSLVLPNLALPFGIFLMRQAMQSFPDELLQAARVDGAGELRIFLRIVLPTMRPALAALAIFMFLASWNDFVYPLVVLRTEGSYTLPVALASLRGVGTTDFGQLLAGTAISVLPILILFLFLQRAFVAGILSGSVKQ